MTRNKKNQAGFTLIELALIIAVLGILGAVGAVKLASMADEAKNAAKQTALANARSALAIAIAKDMDSSKAQADRDGKVTLVELKEFVDGYADGSNATEFKLGDVELKVDNAANITSITLK